MVKLFILTSGMMVVADEEIENGKRVWNCPLQCQYEGIKVQFKSLYHYIKGNSMSVRNAQIHIFLEAEAEPKLANHYHVAVEGFNAAKAGIVIPQMRPPEPKKIIGPN